MRDDSHFDLMALMERTAWQHSDPHHFLLRQFGNVCCALDCLYTRSYNAKPSQQRAHQSADQRAHWCFFTTSVSICGTIFILDIIPVNATVRAALANVMGDVMIRGAIAYQLLRIVEDVNMREVREPEDVLFLQESFSGIMPVHMRQRMGSISFQLTAYSFFRDLLICLFNMRGILLADVSSYIFNR